MTCRELGGKCDQKLSAGSWDEMVQVMTKHVMKTHPDVAKETDSTKPLLADRRRLADKLFLTADRLFPPRHLFEAAHKFSPTWPRLDSLGGDSSATLWP